MTYNRRLPASLAVAVVLALLTFVAAVVPSTGGSHPAASPGSQSHRPGAAADPAIAVHLPGSGPLTAYRYAAASDLPQSGGGVNVSRDFKHEPAPMGIADYGVDAAGDPTAFSTPILMGVVRLTPMVVWNATLASPDSVNFALSGNLEFSSGGASYVYDVSDILQYSTRGGNAQFLDEVWNASAAGAQLRAGSLAGHCGLTTSGSATYYACLANSSLPGNGYFIPLPAQIEVEMTSTVVRGVPAVTCAFNDGFGWLTIETLTFPFAAGGSDSGFVVDGSAYRPDGRYLDAELSLGAPYAGDQTRANKSNVQLELEYWNGHNLQEPTTAYNFASDSPEGISNVTTSVVAASASGNLTADVSAGSSGSLGVLWNRSAVGVVNVTTSVPGGELVVNGGNSVGFVGGSANLTLDPGTYSLAIYNQSLLEGETSTNLSAGGYVSVHLTWQDVFTVTFSEIGLPIDTAWTVSVDAVSLGATAPTIGCLLPNGAHAYAVGPLSGFSATPSGGPLNVAGANQTLTITWSLAQFALTFVPRGLPPATNWTVAVAGSPRSANGSAITFTETPATYVYTVAPIAGYRASPAYGSADLTSGNVTVNVTWTAFTYAVSFDASGLPFGDAWGLAVYAGGVWFNTSTSEAVFTLPLPNGSFSYAVAPPAGYVVATPSGQSTVHGAADSIPLVFRGADGYIVGTVSPTTAQVWVDNVSVPVNQGSFNVSEPPGPYDVRAAAPQFQSVETVVDVLSGQVTPLNWTLAPTPSGAGPASLLPYAALGAVAVVGVAVVAVVVRRRRRRGPAWEPLEGTQSKD